MSHRIIEKRRRDRMNNCLADLLRLIPPDFLKKGRGRIEKTEIIEMAIKHMKYLQELANRKFKHFRSSSIERVVKPKTTVFFAGAEPRDSGPVSGEHFRMGYQECLSEAMRYLIEGQGHFPRDPMCVQLINHLQRHCDNITKGKLYKFVHFNNINLALNEKNDHFFNYPWCDTNGFSLSYTFE
jgi:hypothetical protein